jgi:aryl-alcohol dehydrogenase-like predicted oxidoreductase
MDPFLSRTPPRLQKRVFRLGLATSHGLDEAGIRRALDGEINYVFWNPTARKLTRALRDAVKRDRDRFVIATGATLGFFPGSLRRRAERALRVLGTDYLDVFQLYWLGVMSSAREPVLEELARLREEGKVRTIGTSIHDRPRAGRLAEDSPLDLLMIRYNAAHPGAEQDIFPHLAKRQPTVIAYTATSWRRLLRRPAGWTGAVPTAGHCYRFCLSRPEVDVVLTSPASVAQLEENLRAVAQGPLSAEELGWMRDFGRVVHG